MCKGVKVITDYTSLIHMRHPNELGDTYWAFNLVFANIISIPEEFDFHYIAYFDEAKVQANFLHSNQF